MEDKSQLIVVDANILPDVFTKVLEVKKLMARKDEKSFASACKRIGISRSAYYKYKDSVFSYDELFNRKILGKWLVKIINLAKSRKDLGFSSLNITPTCIKSPVTVMMMHGGYIIP